MAERHSSAVQQVAGVGQQTVEDVRLTQSALWTPSGQITSRSGMVPTGTTNAPGSVLATSPTPNGFVHVQPFRYSLQSVRGGGTFTLCLDAIKDINILSTSADPSNPRRDLIIAQQSDAYFSDANSDMVVRQVVGTPSGSPVDPPVTGSQDYVVLARVTVPAGATTITTGNITQLATQLTVATGGLLPVADATERAAIANPYDGMAIYRRDTDWIEIYDGAAWRTPMFVKTSNLALITNPVSGQQAQNTTDGIVYVHNGVAWVSLYLANGSAPRGKVGEVKRGTTDNIGSTETMMETLSVTVLAGRKYKISWSVGQSSSIASGPPNATVNLRSKSGGSVVVADPSIRSGNIRVFNGTTEVFEFFATYDAAVTETRTFGISATSGGAATQTFNGGNGRCLLIEDIGLT